MEYRVLVLEDNVYKAQCISHVLKEKDYYVQIVESIEELEKSLRADRFDVVIVDMHVPQSNKDLKAIQEEGGLTAINYIRTTSDVIYRPQSIIILSEYAQGNELLCEMHARGYRYPVIEYSNNGKWESELLNQIDTDVNMAGRRADIVVPVAVDVEIDSVLTTLNWEQFEMKGDEIIYYSTKIIDEQHNRVYSVVMCKAKRMGPIGAVDMVAKVLQKLKPSFVFMIGIAAGKKNTVSPCDIVVADQVADYSYGSIEMDNEGKTKFYGRANTFPTDKRVIQIFEGYLRDNEKKALNYAIKESIAQVGIGIDNDVLQDVQKAKIVVGKIISGPCVIKNEDFTNKYIMPSHSDYRALDMETYGVYYAAHHADIKTTSLAVKAISDHGDKNKSDKYQQICVLEAFNLIRYFIMNDLAEL